MAGDEVVGLLAVWGAVAGSEPFSSEGWTGAATGMTAIVGTLIETPI